MATTGAGGLFSWANVLAIRAAGVAPSWSQQVVADRTSASFPGYAEEPALDNPSLGISVDGSQATGLDIRLRENPTTRTMRVSLDTTFDTTSDYRVVVDGTNNNVSGTYADWETAVDAIIAGVADADVTLSREGEGDDSILLVQTVAQDDLSFNFVVTSGTTAVIISADAASGNLEFWSIKRGTGRNPYWGAEENGTYSLTSKGVKGPILDTSQTAQLYCYADLTGVTGDGGSVIPTAVILLGPSTSQESEI